MARKTFDDLLLALQSSMINAQEALKARFGGTVQKICEIDKTGAAGSSVLTFAVPVRGRDEEGFKPLNISILSFKGRRPWLSMLSMEFDCEFKRKNRSGSTGTCRMLIKKSKHNRTKKMALHRIQILFKGQERPSGEVSIDGCSFMEIPAFGMGGNGQSSKMEGRRSFLKGVLDRFSLLWEQQEFIMTVEQTERLREILERQAHETGGEEAGTTQQTPC